MPAFDLSAVKASASLLDLMGLAQQYMAVSIPLWITISQNFQGEVAAGAQNGRAVRTPGEALDLWNNVVDRTLMEFNRSGDFARLQQQLLRALTQSRLELRKLGEKSSQVLDMPTRSEMTDVYRRMHGMQRELQDLRQQVRALRRVSETTGTEAGQLGMATDDRLLSAWTELADFGKRVAVATSTLATVREGDVKIAQTPREEICRLGGRTLHRIIRDGPARIRPPVLVTYAMVGHWNVLDLQDDRSVLAQPDRGRL